MLYNMLNMPQEELITLFEEKFGKSKISTNGDVSGYLDFKGYDHPLPNSIKRINGYLYLKYYNHPLPNSITSVSVTCDLYLRYYNHPLPNSIVSVGTLFLFDYNHPLPNSIKKVDGDIYLDNDYIGLPDNIYEWQVYGKIQYFI